MSFSEEQKRELSAKLNAANVRSRSQAGRNLSYIEGWHAIAEANRIFGFDGWSRETVETTCVWSGERQTKNGSKPAASYIARVRVTAGGVVREGTGAGSGFGNDHGEAHESAVKEAETDATKRALMTFGWPFGLALYDKDQEHVDNGEPAPPPQAAAPKGFHLVNPITGKVTLIERGSTFLDELEHHMAQGRAADWWGCNGSTARGIAEKFPQALKRVEALEDMAMSNVA